MTVSLAPRQGETQSQTILLDVERAYQLSKAVVSFYGALGRNSIDGNGMTVLSTVRFCITGSSLPAS